MAFWKKKPAADAGESTRRIGWHEIGVGLLVLMVIGGIAIYPSVRRNYLYRDNIRMMDEDAPHRYVFCNALLAQIPPLSKASIISARTSELHWNGIPITSITFIHEIRLPEVEPVPGGPRQPYLYWVELKYDYVGGTWKPAPLTIRDMHASNGYRKVEELPNQDLQAYYKGFLEHYDAACAQALVTHPMRPVPRLHVVPPPSRMWLSEWFMKLKQDMARLLS